MGDRVAVLRDGVLQQIGSPEEVFGTPKNLFVARFIGSPSMNLVYGSVHSEANKLSLRLGSQTLDLSSLSPAKAEALRGYNERRLVVGIRPHTLKDPQFSQLKDGCSLRGVVRLRESLGTEIVLHFAIDADRAGAIRSDESEEVAIVQETRVIACVDPASTAREQQTVDLVIEPNRLHFFDPETELAIA